MRAVRSVLLCGLAVAAAGVAVIDIPRKVTGLTFASTKRTARLITRLRPSEAVTLGVSVLVALHIIHHRTSYHRAVNKLWRA